MYSNEPFCPTRAQGMFAATQAGRSLGLDNLIAKRLFPVLGDGGALARAYRLAS
jgi:hypothetical protein